LNFLPFLVIGIFVERCYVFFQKVYDIYVDIKIEKESSKRIVAELEKYREWVNSANDINELVNAVKTFELPLTRRGTIEIFGNYGYVYEYSFDFLNFDREKFLTFPKRNFLRDKSRLLEEIDRDINALKKKI